MIKKLNSMREGNLKNMNNSVQKITEKILSNSRMELEFFMYLPSGYWQSRDHSTVSMNINPILTIRYKQNKKIASEYDYTKAGYKITPKNLYHVVKFFNNAMKWFYDDKYKDIFLNNDGHLMFNADYKKEHVSMPTNDYSQQFMQAIPSVVQIGDKVYEGLHLFINKTAYCIPLTYEEVSTLFGVLKNFSFSEEVAMVIAAYQYIESHNRITDEPKNIIKTSFD